MKELPLNINTLTPIQCHAIQKLFAMGNLSPLLHSTQKKMKQTWQDSGCDEFLVFCSRQLGKTHLGLCIAIEVCLQQPGSRVLYYGPVKDKLKDIVNDTLSFILQFAPKGLIKRHKTEYRWTIGESELRLCALERAHIDSYRGINAKGLIVIEEACFVDAEAWTYAWNSIIDPQRLRHSPKVLINTTPSEDEDHPIHTELLPFMEGQKALARYTIHDNPFLTQEDVSRIQSRVTKDTWLREYLAEIFRSKVNVAVPEFDDAIHTTKLTPPAYANWITTIDFGGSIDPHAIQLAYYDSITSKFCVFRESLMPINTSILEITQEAKRLEEDMTKGRHFRIVDGKGQISIELSKLDFSHMTPTKGEGSFDAHLQALRVGCQNNEILIDESCTHTRAQLKHGKLNKQRTDFLRSLGHHCDLIASLMYGYKVHQTDDPFPHMHGKPLANFHHPDKPKNPLLKLGHQF